jgi:hypothetical protein
MYAVKAANTISVATHSQRRRSNSQRLDSVLGTNPPTSAYRRCALQSCHSASGQDISFRLPPVRADSNHPTGSISS